MLDPRAAFSKANSSSRFNGSMRFMANCDRRLHPRKPIEPVAGIKSCARTYRGDILLTIKEKCFRFLLASYIRRAPVFDCLRQNRNP